MIVCGSDPDEKRSRRRLLFDNLALSGPARGRQCRVFFVHQVAQFPRKSKEWMDWVVPLRGWKSGGVIGTKYNHRQTSEDAQGTRRRWCRIFVDQKVKRMRPRGCSIYALSGTPRLGNLKAYYFSFGGRSHVGRLPSVFFEMEDTMATCTMGDKCRHLTKRLISASL